VSANKQIN